MAAKQSHDYPYPPLPHSASPSASSPSPAATGRGDNDRSLSSCTAMRCRRAGWTTTAVLPLHLLLLLLAVWGVPLLQQQQQQQHRGEEERGARAAGITTARHSPRGVMSSLPFLPAIIVAECAKTGAPRRLGVFGKPPAFAGQPFFGDGGGVGDFRAGVSAMGGGLGVDPSSRTAAASRRSAGSRLHDAVIGSSFAAAVVARGEQAAIPYFSDRPPLSDMGKKFVLLKTPLSLRADRLPQDKAEALYRNLKGIADAWEEQYGTDLKKEHVITGPIISYDLHPAVGFRWLWRRTSHRIAFAPPTLQLPSTTTTTTTAKEKGDGVEECEKPPFLQRRKSFFGGIFSRAKRQQKCTKRSAAAAAAKRKEELSTISILNGGHASNLREFVLLLVANLGDSTSLYRLNRPVFNQPEVQHTFTAPALGLKFYGQRKTEIDEYSVEERRHGTLFLIDNYIREVAAELTDGIMGRLSGASEKAREGPAAASTEWPGGQSSGGEGVATAAAAAAGIAGASIDDADYSYDTDDVDGGGAGEDPDNIPPFLLRKSTLPQQSTAKVAEQYDESFWHYGGSSWKDEWNDEVDARNRDRRTSHAGDEEIGAFGSDADGGTSNEVPSSRAAASRGLESSADETPSVAAMKGGGKDWSEEDEDDVDSPSVGGEDDAAYETDDESQRMAQKRRPRRRMRIKKKWLSRLNKNEGLTFRRRRQFKGGNQSPGELQGQQETLQPQQRQPPPQQPRRPEDPNAPVKFVICGWNQVWGLIDMLSVLRTGRTAAAWLDGANQGDTGIRGGGGKQSPSSVPGSLMVIREEEEDDAQQQQPRRQRRSGEQAQAEQRHQQRFGTPWRRLLDIGQSGTAEHQMREPVFQVVIYKNGKASFFAGRPLQGTQMRLAAYTPVNEYDERSFQDETFWQEMIRCTNRKLKILKPLEYSEEEEEDGAEAKKGGKTEGKKAQRGGGQSGSVVGDSGEQYNDSDGAEGESDGDGRKTGLLSSWAFWRHFRTKKGKEVNSTEQRRAKKEREQRRRKEEQKRKKDEEKREKKAAKELKSTQKEYRKLRSKGVTMLFQPVATYWQRDGIITGDYKSLRDKLLTHFPDAIEVDATPPLTWWDAQKRKPLEDCSVQPIDVMFEKDSPSS